MPLLIMMLVLVYCSFMVESLSAKLKVAVCERLGWTWIVLSHFAFWNLVVELRIFHLIPGEFLLIAGVVEYLFYSCCRLLLAFMVWFPHASMSHLNSASAPQCELSCRKGDDDLSRKGGKNGKVRRMKRLCTGRKCNSSLSAAFERRSLPRLDFSSYSVNVSVLSPGMTKAELFCW